MSAMFTLAAETLPTLRILVVDDVAMNRDIASAFLLLERHQVACVDSGEAAVAAVAEREFDLVLMDVRMPGMDGLEATRRVRALPSPRCDVPVLALTAQVFADQIEQCRRAGMNGHIAKPLQRPALLAALAEIDRARAVGDQREAPARAAAEPKAPLFEASVFKATIDLLPPEKVTMHLRSLIERIEELCRVVRQADLAGEAGDLAAQAHRLAGSAGAFGLQHFAQTARAYERAIQSGRDNEALGRQLADLGQASVVQLREVLLLRLVTPSASA